MPSLRLSQTLQRLHQHSVIGMDAPPRVGAHHIQHVGLLSGDADVCADQSVMVFHMNPPVTEGPMRAHAAGFLDALDAARREDIAVWLATVQTEMARSDPMPIGHRQRFAWAFRDYVIRPAVDRAPDTLTGRGRYLRFSCAGFVAECFAEGAALPLVAEERLLPPVTMQELEAVWGSLVAAVPAADREAWLAQRGLRRGEDWRVLLPAYLLHALGGAALPYVPPAVTTTFP
jgi:hypothetical protein